METIKKLLIVINAIALPLGVFLPFKEMVDPDSSGQTTRVSLYQLYLGTAKDFVEYVGPLELSFEKAVDPEVIDFVWDRVGFRYSPDARNQLLTSTSSNTQRFLNKLSGDEHTSNAHRVSVVIPSISISALFHGFPDVASDQLWLGQGQGQDTTFHSLIIAQSHENLSLKLSGEQSVYRITYLGSHKGTQVYSWSEGSGTPSRPEDRKAKAGASLEKHTDSSCSGNKWERDISLFDMKSNPNVQLSLQTLVSPMLEDPATTLWDIDDKDGDSRGFLTKTLASSGIKVSNIFSNSETLMEGSYTEIEEAEFWKLLSQKAKGEQVELTENPLYKLLLSKRSGNSLIAYIGTSARTVGDNLRGEELRKAQDNSKAAFRCGQAPGFRISEENFLFAVDPSCGDITTITHELGHLFGADHEHSRSSSIPSATDNYAAYWYGASGNRKGTVMSVRATERIPRFSDDRGFCDGERIGGSKQKNAHVVAAAFSTLGMNLGITNETVEIDEVEPEFELGIPDSSGESEDSLAEFFGSDTAKDVVSLPSGACQLYVDRFNSSAACSGFDPSTARSKHFVTFGRSKSDIDAAALNKLFVGLREPMKSRSAILFAGYTDNTGPHDANLILARNRANAVAAEAISAFPDKDIRACVGGILGCGTSGGHSQHRRVQAFPVDLN